MLRHHPNILISQSSQVMGVLTLVMHCPRVGFWAANIIRGQKNHLKGPFVGSQKTPPGIPRNNQGDIGEPNVLHCVNGNKSL